MNRLLYPVFSGKNSKLAYFTRELLASCIPAAVYRRRLPGLLASIDRRPDRADILARADYCCRPGRGGAAPAPAGHGMPVRPPERFRVGEQRMPRRSQAYYFDSRSLLRYFPPDLPVSLLAGDVTWVPDTPTLVKSRPIADDGSNANAVLLPLNKVRHFLFVHDRRGFSDKADSAVFRGKIANGPVHKRKREALFARCFGMPGLDLGDSSPHPVNPAWQKPKLTLAEQLRHKFVLCIEGHDVASNLKWVLSSNSLALMPRPEFETWFLEGTLVPGVHYVEIAPDYSDVAEKMRWYASHPDAAQRILDAAHAHVARFRDPRRERLVALLVLHRYFEGALSA